jgi:hypothetical protein
MAVKKNYQDNNEIDLLKISKKWWSLRRFVFFQTIIVCLISTFILIITDKAFINKTQKYVTAVIKSDLGNKNSLIYAGYRSQPYILETLKRLSLDIDPNELLEYLIIEESTDPLTENLKNQILSADERKLKSLALTNEELSKIMEDLNNNSKELITVQLYHEPLNLSAEQAKNLIVSLSKTVNENLILRSSREDISITIIETNNIKKDFLDNSDQIARLSNIINSSQKNISEMKTNYSSLLQNYDLENLFTLANITQKNLYEISKQLGSTYAIDNINVNIRQKERDINDLISSLELLDRQKIETFSSSNQNSNTSEVSGSVTQLDAEVFDKILSIGSLLNLNSFRLNTVEKIQQLQQEKSNLINQKELLNLPYYSNGNSIDLEIVTEKIVFLANEVNKVGKQVRDLTEPKAAFEIINNPTLIELNSKSLFEYATIILVLTFLAFLIISLILILIPVKKS